MDTPFPDMMPPAALSPALLAQLNATYPLGGAPMDPGPVDAPVAAADELTLDAEDLERAICHVIGQRLAGAREGMAASRTLWRDYLKRYTRAAGKDSSDPLERYGTGRRPTLARLIHVLRGKIIKMLCPTPQNMHFFEARAKSPGLEDPISRAGHLLRDKFKTLRVRGRSWYSTLDRCVETYLVIGNDFSLVHHELVDGQADDDQATGGPFVERLDPMNVYPEDLSVGNIAETNVHVYAPLADDDLDELYPEHAERVREGQQTTASSQDPNADRVAEDHEDAPVSHEANNDKYKRYLYIGRLPVADLLEALASAGVDKEALGATRPEQRRGLVEILAEAYDFDAGEGHGATWWVIEHVGEVCLACRPWPLWLPEGMGPVEHALCFPREGMLLGHGLYDMAGPDELMQQHYDQMASVLAEKIATAPLMLDTQAIDAKWLQARGLDDGELRLDPDDVIPWDSLAGTKPAEYLDVNGQALQVLIDRAQMHFNQQRELTGSTSALEGTDTRSQTATQNANNLQQAMDDLEYHVTRLESTWLWNIVARAWLIQWQALAVDPLRTELATVTEDERILSQVPVSYQDFRGLDQVDLLMTGSVSPYNRQMQHESLGLFANRYLAMMDPMTGAPVLNARQMMLEEAKLLRIPSPERLEGQPNPGWMQQAQANLARFMGWNAPGWPQASAGGGIGGTLPRMQAQGPAGLPMMGRPGGGGGGGPAGQPMPGVNNMDMTPQPAMQAPAQYRVPYPGPGV